MAMILIDRNITFITIIELSFIQIPAITQHADPTVYHAKIINWYCGWLKPYIAIAQAANTPNTVPIHLIVDNIIGLRCFGFFIFIILGLDHVVVSVYSAVMFDLC